MPSCFDIPQTQICFSIGGEHITWHGSKLTNFLGKQQLELSTCSWSGESPWNHGRFEPDGVKQSICFQFFFSVLSLEVKQNTKMTSPRANSEFWFPLTSMFRVLVKQNSLFPLWPVMKSLSTYCTIQMSSPFDGKLCHCVEQKSSMSQYNQFKFWLSVLLFVTLHIFFKISHYCVLPENIHTSPMEGISN